MRKSVLLVFAIALSFLMVSPLTAQDRARRRRAPDPPPSTEGQAEPRRAPDYPQRRQGQERERERAEPRRQRQQPPSSRRYAVPRNRPVPRPHPRFGPYNRMMHQGQYYFWRPYPRIWIRPNVCVAGYWEWDSWIESWVWVEGYCNTPRYRPGPGFYFWFDFGR